MEPFKTHDANCDAVDSATAGTFPSPEVFANMLGECEVVDNATAGTFPSPEVSANMLGEHESLNRATDSTSPSMDTAIPSTSADISSNQSGEPVNCLSRLEAYNAFVNKSRQLSRNRRPTDLNNSERIDVVTTIFGDKLKPINSIEKHKKDLLKAISTFISKTEKMYTGCKSNINFFKKKHKDWLSKPFLDDLPMDVKIQASVSLPSPRTAKYMLLSQRQKLRQRRILEQKLKEEPPEKLVKAFSETVMSSSSSGSRVRQEMELIINTCIETPEKAIEIATNIKKADSAPKQQPYTPEEALALIIDWKFSVNTYKIMRQGLVQRGFHAFPPYYLVQTSKSECYPKAEIQKSENEVSVSLQGLIDHTFERIIKTIDTNLTQYCDQQNLSQLKCVFEASWGFDGSTEPSQKHSENKNEEPSLFATIFVPLRISHGSQTIWSNPCSQVYSSRPLHIQYRKETPELIKSEKQYVENQIQRLSLSFAYTSKNQLVTSTSSLTMLSEQAAESKNQLWRSDREHHSRKMDRTKVIIDLFHRALESSDPVIANLRLMRQNKTNLEEH